MKILITSDNHLGFKERDPILSNDSFDTFEEILITANIRDVDIILQGGDLYHDNRPSRSCISKSIALFKKYCTGNKAMKFKCSGKLNYDDPNLNISIPVLSIHGNHDDPSGIFTTSPMHILESTNLVNYLGKIPSIEQIDLHPIIFEMDNQRIAIYALGHVKDRRLYKLFVDSKINFIKPKENCFSILMVHQNRREYTPKDYLPYEFLPNWFDLVIYGHEHESVIVKYNSFILLQSGSTVRTSLSEKEVFDKFIYLLDTKEGKLERIELKSTRKLFIGSLENVEFEEEVVDKINNMLKYSKDNVKSKFYEEDGFKNIFNQKMFNIEDSLIKNEEIKSEYPSNNNCNETILINENNKRFKNSLVDRLNDLQNKILLPMVRLKVSLKNIY
ncbi:DNA repair protein (mre11), partial [Anncaliia algerae PRA109]